MYTNVACVWNAEDVKSMLLDQKFGDGEVLRRVEEHQLSGLHRVVDSTAVDFEERPVFMPLTGKNLGHVWNEFLSGPRVVCIEQSIHGIIIVKIKRMPL